MIIAGVDVGGTRIKAVLMNDAGEVLKRATVNTPRDDASGVRTAAAAAAAVSSLAGPYDAIGLCAPGIVDPSTGTVIESANLGWRNVAFAGIVNGLLPDTPVAFGHDVRSGAVAEARWGASAGREGMTAFVPIGTGISAAFTGGDSSFGADPQVGEIGVIPVFTRPGDPTRVTLESIASGPAIARAAATADTETALRAALGGDRVAQQAWADAIAALADAIAWLCAVVAPSTVVLGGGVSRAGDALLTPLRRELTSRLPRGQAPELLLAELGEWAGAIGAATRALDEFAR